MVPDLGRQNARPAGAIGVLGTRPMGTESMGTESMGTELDGHGLDGHGLDGHGLDRHKASANRSTQAGWPTSAATAKHARIDPAGA